MKKSWQYIFLLFLIVGTVLILAKKVPYQNEKGIIFGTLYNITYQNGESLHTEIEKELRKVDSSLSPFNDSSIISHINRNETIMPDSMFTTVFRLAQEVSAQTEGAFDITVAPLVNAWGFGFKHAQKADSLLIDSLLQFVGYQKVRLDDNDSIVKEDARLMLDCSAIAKGFGSDVVARYFDSKGITNYMVEIGGEIVVKGKNLQDKDWKIAILKPEDDSLCLNNEQQATLTATNTGIATSGNYRNYYYKDGKKFAHTIHPATGYPVQHSLLSVTVLAPTCALADALATAFMVMGVEKAMQYCDTHPEIEAYFIFADDKGDYQTAVTSNSKRFKETKNRE